MKLRTPPVSQGRCTSQARDPGCLARQAHFSSSEPRLSRKTGALLKLRAPVVSQDRRTSQAQNTGCLARQVHFSSSQPRLSRGAGALLKLATDVLVVRARRSGENDAVPCFTTRLVSQGSPVLLLYTSRSPRDRADVPALDVRVRVAPRQPSGTRIVFADSHTIFPARRVRPLSSSASSTTRQGWMNRRRLLTPLTLSSSSIARCRQDRRRSC